MGDTRYIGFHLLNSETALSGLTKILNYKIASSGANEPPIYAQIVEIKFIKAFKEAEVISHDGMLLPFM